MNNDLSDSPKKDGGLGDDFIVGANSQRESLNFATVVTHCKHPYIFWPILAVLLVSNRRWTSSLSWHNIRLWLFSPFKGNRDELYHLHLKKFLSKIYWLTNPPWLSVLTIRLQKTTDWTAAWSPVCCGVSMFYTRLPTVLFQLILDLSVVFFWQKIMQ